MYPRFATALVLSFLLFPVAGQAQQMRQEDVILSVAGGTVRWAAVYKAMPERTDDPYFHVRVFEHKRGSEPWCFRELAFHMAVTPQALEKSRSGKRVKIYQYKDVEIRGAYRRWLEDASVRSDVPVCATDILDCIKRQER
jgi:hypothetical protein